jgi:hypothetical protein
MAARYSGREGDRTIAAKLAARLKVLTGVVLLALALILVVAEVTKPRRSNRTCKKNNRTYRKHRKTWSKSRKTWRKNSRTWSKSSRRLRKSGRTKSSTKRTVEVVVHDLRDFGRG